MRRLTHLLPALALMLVMPALAGAQVVTAGSDDQAVRVQTLKTVQDGLDAVTIQFKAASSGMLGPVVTGAPYSASTTTEKIQVLADGNRIVNRTTYNVTRDGQGRVRREEIADGGTVASVMIMDPVANASYVLDPATRTARKLALLQNVTWSEPRATREAQVVTSSEAFAGALRANVAVARGAVDGGWTMVSVEPSNFRREALGTQVMEGVQVEGTRTVSSIPAGQIGNERQIDTVTEQWYSKDLQTTIMSRHSDPRNGETTYHVTNLKRGEPDPTMFQVPADYTVKEAVKEIQPKKVVK